MIRCAPDEDGCIDLLAILRTMNQISQEQAWALAYELARLMQRMWPAGYNCAIIESLAQIYIHQEGFVHEKSLWTKISSLGTQASDQDKLARLEHEEQRQESNQNLKLSSKQRISSNIGSINNNNNNINNNSTTRTTISKLPPTPPITPELSDEIMRRSVASTEHELIASLGMALFWALDYEIPDDEERKLNIALEYLIVQSQKEMSLDELEQICIKRLPVAKKSQADTHYRQVCKSLIQDTIELSIFLDKIYTATMALGGGAAAATDDDDDELQNLGLPRALKINDWARLWMQVIRELRQHGSFVTSFYD